MTIPPGLSIPPRGLRSRAFRVIWVADDEAQLLLKHRLVVTFELQRDRGKLMKVLECLRQELMVNRLPIAMVPQDSGETLKATGRTYSAPLEKRKSGFDAFNGFVWSRRTGRDSHAIRW